MILLKLSEFSQILGEPQPFSLKRNLCEKGGIPYEGSLRKTLEFIRALRHFAPEVRLHSEDKERPSSVEYFFSGVYLEYDGEVIEEDNISAQSILGKEQDGISSENEKNEKAENWKLTIAERNRKSIRQGEASEFKNGSKTTSVPCYCHVKPLPNSSWYDFQYIFFYPYNSMGALGIGLHEGDWEHITVRVDLNDVQIKGIYFSAHESGYWTVIPLAEGAFLKIPFYHLNDEGQPIVYSAKNSHASYPFPGTIKREYGNNVITTVSTVVGTVTGGVPGAILGGIFGNEAEDRILPDDHTDKKGPIWDCRQRLIFVGELDCPTPGQEWIRFSGRWGKPTGPAFQDSWWGKKEKGGPKP